MWGGFSWASAAWASQPQYGGGESGLVFGSDDTVFAVYGEDMADTDIVFGGDLGGSGRAFGGDTSFGEGIVFGGDDSIGRVVGGDERT